MSSVLDTLSLRCLGSEPSERVGGLPEASELLPSPWSRGWLGVFFHCSVPSTLSEAWHVVAAQQLFVE